MLGRRLLVLLLVAALWLALTPVADARLVARSSLVETKTGAFKIKVKLTSTKPVNASTKPRRVKMKTGEDVYPLELTTSTTRTNLGVWKSRAYTGAEQQALFNEIDETVRIVVISRSGRKTIESTLDGPTGWVTGQEAIDQMTSTINGGAVRYFKSNSAGDTETFELHLCTDGVFRYYHHTNFAGGGGFVATEQFGQPWAVTEALIIRQDYAAAQVEGTFTTGEQASALIEYSGAQDSWYWDGNAVEVLQASCEPVT